MDLTFTADEDAFRAEARAWLPRTCPPPRCPPWRPRRASPPTARGRRELAADRWSVVSWPAAYGGRGAGLVRWLVFEEEYYAAGAPGRVGQNGISLLAPDPLRPRHARSSGPGCCRRWPRGEVSGRRPGRSRRRARTWPRCGRRAVRTDGGWLLSGQKTWSSRAAFADRAFGLFRSDPDAAEAAPGADVPDVRPARAGRHRPPDRPPGRQAGLRRTLPGRGVRAGRGRHRRAGPGLAGRDVDGGQRARADAALPRPLPGRRRPAGRAVA